MPTQIKPTTAAELRRREARPETAAELRDAIGETERQIDRLSDQRDKLLLRLALRLTPVAPGDRFTTTGTHDRWYRQVAPGSVFVCDEVLSYAGATPKASYLLKGRRVTKSGELSKLVFYFTREHKPRKVKGGAK